jgi:tetratricopeptide (TPR) repeat protein
MTNESSEDTILDLLDEVLREGLLTEEGTGAHILYHFWHPLIVSHLYDRLSAARRAQLHRRAAEAIKATQAGTTQAKIAAAVFHHLRKGGGDPQDIAYFAELAGNQAYSLTAYSEAQYYYVQALLTLVGGTIGENATISTHIQHIITVLITRPSTPVHALLPLCRLLELAAECSFILGNFEDARTLYETILALRTSEVFKKHINIKDGNEESHYKREAQIQALLWREIVSTWKATGAYEKAHEGCQRGKEVLRQADETACTAWACLHLTTGDILRYEGNYQEARRYSQEAIAMLEQFVQPIAPEDSEPMLALHHVKQQTTKERYTLTHLETRTERALRGDATDLAYAYEQLGVVEASVGHANEAQRYMRLALTGYEQQERISEVVRVCGNLGAVFTMKSEHTQARLFLNRALNLAERSGDLPNIAFITSNFGDVANHSGDLLEAEAWYKRSLAIAERINDRELVSWCSILLADVQQDLGYLREAAINLHHAIRVGRSIKNSRCIRFALVTLGDLRITEAIIACKLQPKESETSEQTPVTCQRLLRRAKSTLQRAISQEDVEVETIIDCKLLLATVYFLQNDLLTAQQIALQTLQKAQTQETIRVIGRAQRLLGRILSEQKNYHEADFYFEQAVKIFREQELHVDYARTLHGYGLSLVQRALTTKETQQEKERGMDFLREARAIFNTSHATIDFSWTDLVISSYTSPLKESVI